MAIDEKHLNHVKEMICNDIKRETKEEILTAYSWTDQINATGSEKDTIQAAINTMITEGATLRANVQACTTFDELRAVIPEASD